MEYKEMGEVMGRFAQEEMGLLGFKSPWAYWAWKLEQTTKVKTKPGSVERFTNFFFSDWSTAPHNK